MTRHQRNLPGRRERLIDKIKSRVVVDRKSSCWIWQGPTSGNGRGGGYGRMYLDGQTVAVHKVMFCCAYGYIPGKLQVDHICENRLCCNPGHLELVTHIENQRRKKLKQLRLEVLADA